MDEELKRRWVEALRSGEYKQGRKLLHRKDAYCCLGVLYELKEGRDAWRSWFGLFLTKDGWKDFLSKEFLAAVELDRDLASDLGLMNDHGISFEEIANEIERRA